MWLSVLVTAIFASSLPAAGGLLGAPAAPVEPIQNCDVSPRSRAEIAGLLADSGIATPTATTGGQTLPAGVPVDAETSAAMESIVQMWLACQNAGEPLRAWTLFSDGYLSRLLSRQSVAVNFGADSATPISPPNGNGGARLLEIRGQRMLPDGRFGATVTVAYPSIPLPKTFFFFFTETAGRLVIDGILGEISFSVP